MKKFLSVLLIFISFPLISSAQTQEPVFLGIEAGVTFPMSPQYFQTSYTTSYNFGVLVQKPVSDILSIGGGLNYSDYVVKTPSGYSNYNGGGLSFLSFAGFLKLTDNITTQKLNPYGKAGLGIHFAYAHPRYSGSRTSTENGLAIILGAGMDYNITSSNKLSLELSYRVNNLPGGSINGLLLDIGYHFKL